ncbi:MAG: MGMT family protein [Candidatus Berkelbacteria bacterium]|nr:MAG: MGMT family protein [Candidatus Berkelbacteria bacterium]QQG51843.1 MAG: MGMT family protein [Candidatus Berkelbacteria bacterium]
MFASKVVKIIKSIPRGKVATYGQVAALAGTPRAAIVVGQILHHQTEVYNLPWQRVINSKGMISTTCLEHPPAMQAGLLQEDGVTVSEQNGQFWVDLKKYGWQAGM